MNQYKEDWMKQAMMLVPTTVRLNSSGSLEATWSNPFPSTEKAGQFGIAVQKTYKAAAAGLAISAIDGPIPVMDIVGFGVTTGMSLIAWIEYFS